jgi:hypothetical protein
MMQSISAGGTDTYFAPESLRGGKIDGTKVKVPATRKISRVPVALRCCFGSLA